MTLKALGKNKVMKFWFPPPATQHDMSLRSPIESGFTTVSGSLTKAIQDCFSTMVDKIESNLLDSHLEISEPDELARGGKEKERETTSIESPLEKRGKTADDKRGKASS
jgi:hypothetical protein